jgi:hypothetical protein
MQLNKICLVYFVDRYGEYLINYVVVGKDANLFIVSGSKGQL